MSDDPLVTMLQIVKAGYAPTIEEAEKMDARQVMQALYYEEFLSDYEMIYMELNKDG